MKFIHKKLQDGDLRYLSGFLVFPKRIENETRWLEWAVWTQRYCIPLFSPESSFWRDIYWGTPKCPHDYEDWDKCPVCGH